MSSDFTQDDFLGGRLRICQEIGGYRAGADPVFLAAAPNCEKCDASGGSEDPHYITHIANVS